jgi:hypothetical protein
MNGAIALGNMIITNPDMEDKQTLQHEYGHYLDFKFHFKYNKTEYLSEIGLPSIRSAAGSEPHAKSIPERRANRLGGSWFNNRSLMNLFRP